MLTMELSNPNWLILFGWFFALANTGITYFWFYSHIRHYQNSTLNYHAVKAAADESVTRLLAIEKRLGVSVGAFADVAEHYRDALLKREGGRDDDEI